MKRHTDADEIASVVSRKSPSMTLSLLRITIHRGTHEIGGTCIELKSRWTSILLDLGQSLQRKPHDDFLNRLRPDAVIVSHPHLDHYGLIESFPGPQCNSNDSDNNEQEITSEVKQFPVYIGKIGHRLIEATRTFRGVPPLPHEFRYFEAGKKFEIGPFTITPYPVDHSASEAFAFLIEVEGKRLFYSGDFRMTGKKKVLTEKLMANPPKDIDLLFLEGTMMKRGNQPFPDEESVYQTILETIENQEHISFVICSGQNIDRISSLFKACLKAKKTMVTDIYTAWVLEQFARTNPRTGVPNLDWGKIRVIFPRNQRAVLDSMSPVFGEFVDKAYTSRILAREIEADPARFVSLGRLSSAKAIEKYKTTGRVNVIYSQWLGYLDDPDNATQDSRKVSSYRNNQDPKVNFIYAHTSGHASIDDLKRYVEALDPKTIVPVHTDAPEEYARHFQGRNILQVEDGNSFGLMRQLDFEQSQQLLDTFTEILFKIDPMHFVSMAIDAGMMESQEDAWVHMGNEYDIEVASILNQIESCDSMDSLDVLIHKVFRHYFCLSDYDDHGISEAYHTLSARLLWNAWLEALGKPAVDYPEPITLPSHPKPIVIEID